MKLHPSLFALALLAAPSLTLAGGKAVIEAGSGTDTMQTAIEFDGDKVRMDMPGADVESYMVVRDGRIYSVTHQDGQPFVIDMTSMTEMLGGMLTQSFSLDGEIGELTSLEDTGRNETIAGIRGRVYLANYTDGDGNRQSDEIVIGSDILLREMTSALQTWATTMVQSLGTENNEDAMQELLGKGDGVLRMGADYRLVSLEDSSPDASRFELPAAPQQMPDIGALMSGAGGEPGSNPLGGLFGEKVERQQDRVEGRTEQEVDQATDRAVDRVVDKAFNRIFGR